MKNILTIREKEVFTLLIQNKTKFKTVNKKDNPKFGLSL